MSERIELAAMARPYIEAFVTAGYEVMPVIESALDLWQEVTAHPGFEGWMEATARGDQAETGWATFLLKGEVERWKLLLDTYGSEDTAALAIPFLTALLEEDWGLRGIKKEYIDKEPVQFYDIPDEWFAKWSDPAARQAGEYDDTESFTLQFREMNRSLEDKSGVKQFAYIASHPSNEGMMDADWFTVVTLGEDGKKSGIAVRLPLKPEKREEFIESLMGKGRQMVRVGEVEGVEFLQLQVVSEEGLFELSEVLENATLILGERELNPDLVKQVALKRLDPAETAQLPRVDVSFYAAELARRELVDSLVFGVAGGFDSPEVREARLGVIPESSSRSDESNGGNVYASPSASLRISRRFSQARNEPSHTRARGILSPSANSGLSEFILPRQMWLRKFDVLSGIHPQAESHGIHLGSNKGVRSGRTTLLFGEPRRQGGKTTKVSRSLPREGMTTQREENSFGEKARDMVVADRETMVGFDGGHAAEGVIWQRGDENERAMGEAHALREKESEQGVLEAAQEERELDGVWRPEPVVVETGRSMRRIEVPVWRERMAVMSLQRDERGWEIVAEEGSFRGPFEYFDTTKYLSMEMRFNKDIRLNSKEMKEFDEEPVVLESGIVIPRHLFLTQKMSNRVADWLMKWRRVVKVLGRGKSKMVHSGLVCLIALNLLIEQLDEQIGMCQKDTQEMMQKPKLTIVETVNIHQWDGFLGAKKFGEATFRFGDWGRLSWGPRIIDGDGLRKETQRRLHFERAKQNFSFAQPPRQTWQERLTVPLFLQL